jgi:CRISPR-associated DxTHG motif protein
MKKTIITILGIISHTNQKSEPKKDEELARYSLGSRVIDSFKIKEKKYINMFDVIVSNYKDENIIAIGTKKAIDTQKSVLEHLDIMDINVQYIEIEDEKQYDKILEIINNQIVKNENIIFDVSHGFRHLPILATISLIVQNIQNSEKVQEIIYAKEEIPYKEYEIISLKEYLDLANLSYLLNTFDTNYTVGNEFSFVNENYQHLADNLRIISTHILANSLKQLLGEESHISKTIQILNDLMQNDSNIKTFQKSIESIIKHLQKIQNLDKEVRYMQLFRLSQMMKERGYVLNAITLLNEAVGFYCVETLKDIDDKVKEHIEKFEKNDDNLYELAHQSKNLVKLRDRFQFPYLSTDIKLTSGQKTSLQKKKKNLKKKLNPLILKEIQEMGFDVSLTKIEKSTNKPFKKVILECLSTRNDEDLINLIKQTENLRNNLAHANSSEKIENVQSKLSNSLKEFKQIVKI